MNVFDFFDYRKFLAAWYDYKKASNKAFSYRAFALRAGYKSPGFYLDIVKGHKSLSPTMAESFAHAIGLKDKELRYFLLMVQFCHTDIPSVQAEIFDQMSALLPKRLRALRENQQDYYQNWHNVAIREALGVIDIDRNFADLGQFLRPSIPASQAKSAIETLHALDLIDKNPDGYWKPIDQAVEPSANIPTQNIRQFQKNMMEKAMEALDRIPREQRNISCTTFSVSEQGMQTIMAKVDDFRKQILDIIRADQHEDRVVQFNIQVFPLTQQEER